MEQVVIAQPMNAISGLYGNYSRTQLILGAVGIVLFLVLVYWLVVRYVGKNMSGGKSYTDNPSTGGSPSTGGGGGQNTTTSVSFPEDPFLFANELNLRLTDSWFGSLCSEPDNTCFRLQKLANSGDEFIKVVGRAYYNTNGLKLSEAIKKNPCCCTKSSWTCRDTKYPLDKNNLVNRVAALGF